LREGHAYIVGAKRSALGRYERPMASQSSAVRA
jgi:hypothetical protein